MPGRLTTDAVDECPSCLKPTSLCVCRDIAPIDNRVGLLILQHPQEQDKSLGTARLTQLHLRNAELKVGLSWPSLANALGRPANPQRWAVLYLGSAAAAALCPDREIVVVDAKGVLAPDQAAALASVEGVIVLDGTWSQAKTLWWRNPWLLKCRRVILGPRHPSRYGKVRREPRRDSLSTLEASALLLSRLENRPEIETILGESFQKLLALYRQTRPDAGRRDGGRHRRPARGARKRNAADATATPPKARDP